MVVAVTDALSRNGINTNPVSGCPYSEVTVAKHDGYFSVTIQAPGGEVIEREAVEEESVASIIESWVRSDLSSHMLSPLAADISSVGVGAETTALNTEEDTTFEPEQPIPVAWIDLDLEAGFGFDGSTWFGGALSGCAMVGPVCLGALVGVGSDPALSGDSDLLGTRRMILGLSAVVDYPFFLDRFTLRPGVEVGAVYLRMTKKYIEYDTDGNNESENEGDSQSADGIEELAQEQRWDFSLGAHLIGSLKLGRGFSFLVIVSAIFLPAADTSQLFNDGTTMTGSPRGLARLGAGLEYGF